MTTKISFAPKIGNFENAREYFPRMEENLSQSLITLSPPWYPGSYADSLGKTKDFILMLLAIRGVTKISVSAYELHVTKSPGFSWDEIHPQVLAAFILAFGLKEVEDVELKSRFSSIS